VLSYMLYYPNLYFLILHVVFLVNPFPFFSADESIRQTLDMLNSDYPDVDTPAKVLFDDKPLPGAPVFDATPLAFALDTDGSGERTAGPLFDSTPAVEKKNDDIEENAQSSPIPSHTPQWQDTPSQSVDGTEEVTQEYMVPEQVAKYAREHKQRLDAHDEKIRKYERKRKKNIRVVARGDEYGLSDDEPIPDGGSSPDGRKARVVVRKVPASRLSQMGSPGADAPARSPDSQPSGAAAPARIPATDTTGAAAPDRTPAAEPCGAAAPYRTPAAEPSVAASADASPSAQPSVRAPPRRSPRIVQTVIGANQTSSSARKNTSRKRCRLVDETYVPEVDADAAVREKVMICFSFVIFKFFVMSF
jgi:hypothetical protein